VEIFCGKFFVENFLWEIFCGNFLWKTFVENFVKKIVENGKEIVLSICGKRWFKSGVEIVF
jgi:hypothetical protein